MANVNEQVKNLLENGLENVAVRYQYPEDFNTLPVVTYYTLTRQGSFAYDNEVVCDDHTICIDIWADFPKQCEELGEQIRRLMRESGWDIEFERDIPNPDPSVKHRTIQFEKTFYSEEE